MIVIVSGHSELDYKAKAIEAGANYYFVKPAEPQKLIELVNLVADEPD
jgi:YesN/AraC family two-component response regulator